MKRFCPAVSICLAFSVLASSAFAGKRTNPNPQVVPHSPHYAELSVRWWQWALGQQVTLNNEETTNPLVDTTGVAAYNGQPSNVFFLAGLLSINSGLVATAERTITVRRGTHYFFPILNSEQDNVGVTPPLSVAQLRQNAAFSVTQITSMFAEIDGVELQDLMSYRTISPVFAYRLPNNDVAQGSVNIAYYLTGGAITDTGIVKPAVGDGFYLLLKPLPPGKHTIRFGGTSQTLDGNGNPATFQLDITYHITVTAH